ncbi:MAG: helix-turn-helix domain-containing protein [Gammaproteobacteria bacterium]|nr:helix-turn-helix domain-containing protein [Gammaproteobacteria bacterium]
MNIGHYRMIERAVLAFTEKTGLPACLEDDGGMIRIDSNGKHYSFAVEAAPLTPRGDISPFRAMNTLSRYSDKPFLIISRHMSAKKAEKLKQADILFLDTAGNAYINAEALFVFIKGNPRPEHSEKIEYIFETAGLKVIFALLHNKDSEMAAHEQIAKAAGVSPSSVSRILSSLRTKGYLDKTAKSRYCLIDRSNLLHHWLRAYPKYLRDKTLIGSYRTLDESWQEKADISPFAAYWGGETAAVLLTRYLRPLITTVYLNKPEGRFLLKHKLRKEPLGDIELREKFWHFDWQVKKQTVPALLVYADLLATGDSRNIETAGIIYQNELAELIESA